MCGFVQPVDFPHVPFRLHVPLIIVMDRMLLVGAACGFVFGALLFTR